jgi:hypothetical protein
MSWHPRSHARAAAKATRGLIADADLVVAGGPPATPFDIRLAGVPAFTGRASHGIAQLLRRHGFLLAAPESFLVGQPAPETAAKAAGFSVCP